MLFVQTDQATIDGFLHIAGAKEWMRDETIPRGNPYQPTIKDDLDAGRVHLVRPPTNGMRFHFGGLPLVKRDVDNKRPYCVYSGDDFHPIIIAVDLTHHQAQRLAIECEMISSYLEGMVR